MFLTNLHAFGKYYWDSWMDNNSYYDDSSIYKKIDSLKEVINRNIDIYEETVKIRS